MKKLLLIFPLVLMGCSTSLKLNKEEQMLASYPVTITQEDFHFSELLLLVKIDHNKKTAVKCHGVFPNDEERLVINNMYLNQKAQKRVKYEKKLIISLNDKHTEYVVYHLSGGDEQVTASIKACERLQVLLQQDGYELVSSPK